MCICNASSIANFLFMFFFYFADRPTLFFSPICMRNIKNNNDALMREQCGYFIQGLMHILE